MFPNRYGIGIESDLKKGKSLDQKQIKRIIHLLCDEIFQEGLANANIKNVEPKFIYDTTETCFCDDNGQPYYENTIVS